MEGERKVQTVYLAGPMSHRPAFNFPAFDAAAEDLRSRGYKVISPAELDNDEIRGLALASPDGENIEVRGQWRDFLSRDVRLVAHPDTEAVVLLPGWKESAGATLEADVAHRLGKPLLSYPDLRPVEPLEGTSAFPPPPARPGVRPRRRGGEGWLLFVPFVAGLIAGALAGRGLDGAGRNGKERASFAVARLACGRRR